MVLRHVGVFCSPRPRIPQAAASEAFAGCKTCFICLTLLQVVVARSSPRPRFQPKPDQRFTQWPFNGALNGPFGASLTQEILLFGAVMPHFFEGFSDFTRGLSLNSALRSWQLQRRGGNRGKTNVCVGNRAGRGHDVWSRQTIVLFVMVRGCLAPSCGTF